MNQFQSDILELQFKKDSNGRIAIFPKGLSKPGYIIPDDEKKNEIKSIYTKHEMRSASLVFIPYLFNFSIYAIFLAILLAILIFIYFTSIFYKEIDKATIGLIKVEHSYEFFKNEFPKKATCTVFALVLFTFSWAFMPNFLKIFGFKAIIAFIFIHALLIILTIIVLYNATNNKTDT